MKFNDASKAAWRYLVGRGIGVDEINDDDTLRLYMELDGIPGDILWPGTAMGTSGEVSIASYGNVVEGGDITAALQAAVNANVNSGRDVVIPAGNYSSGQIEVTGRVNIRSAGNTNITLNDGTVIWLNITGSLGAEVPLSVAAGSGDLALTTASAHGLVAGDYFRLLSQRNALHADAGLDWRLGFNTPTSATCYFGEILRVDSAPSGTSVNLDTGLLFPAYRPDATLETSVDARAAATVAKITPVKDIEVRGFKVTGRATETLIKVTYGVNVSISDVIYRATGDSIFIIFESSLGCKAVDCEVYYPDLLLNPADHFKRNAYKTYGSQDCGFVRCYGERATQTFDFTYGGATPRMASVHCYVENSSTKAATSNGATSHGGTYGTRFINNRFLECRLNGLSNRSRNAIISGNTITGSRVAATYGMNLYEGWARNCVVSNNVISGFEEGFKVLDGADANEYFEWVGLQFFGNTITQWGTYAFRVHRNAPNKYIGECGINVELNQFIGCWNGSSTPKGVYVGPYVVGMRIKDNNIDLSGIGNAGIQIQANSGNHHIEGNTIMNSTSRGIWLEAVSDAVVWPSGVSIHLGQGNKFVNVTTSRYFWGASVTRPMRAGEGGTGNTGAQITVTGSRAGNAALASLITQLVNAGVVQTDSSTA